MIITFLGQEFDTDLLDEDVVNYILTYNRVIDAPRRKGADDDDFDFRMNQALQMFGNQEVVDAIQTIIDNN